MTAGLCGVILAAGGSSRMGTDKALLPCPPAAAPGPPSNQTFLSAAIESFAPFTELTIVVSGKNEAALAPVVFANGAFLARNPQPDRGQFSSLKVGLQEVLNRGRDAALVTLVDRPAVQATTIQALCDKYNARSNDTWAVVPEYGGRHGHPIVLGREMIEAFLKAAPSETAQNVEHRHQQRIFYLPVGDAAVIQNVNTPQDYAALTLPASPQSK